MRHVLLLLLAVAACDAPSATPDAAVPSDDAAPLPDDGPLAYGERCGDGQDDDEDGLADEDCAPRLFAGLYAPRVSSDPAIPSLETDAGRAFTVLQTYHSLTALGIERTGPDLAAIFARGRVAHLNVEPSGYSAAAYASPTSPPLSTDLAAMATAIGDALVAAPQGRILLTFGAEMNGAWTDWGCLPAAQYIALYRAAHTTFVNALDARGIDRRRVRFAWGPDSRGTGTCATAAAYYPGHAHVDLVGLSAYRAESDSVTATVTTPMTELFDALAYPTAWRDDRFVLLQTGTRAVADRDAWITDLFATLTTDPRVAGAIYFDAGDWAIAEDGAGWTGLTTALAATPTTDAALEATFAPHFWDVPYRAAYFGEVQALVDAGVAGGCATEPRRFCPDDALDRRSAAILLARAFALPAGSPTPAFADVPPGDPAFEAVQALVARGAIAGCAPDRFCPDDDLRQPQLAAILAALGASPGAATDVVASRAWAAVQIAHAARLVPLSVARPGSAGRHDRRSLISSGAVGEPAMRSRVGPRSR